MKIKLITTPHLQIENAAFKYYENLLTLIFVR